MKAIDIAKYVITRCTQKETPISNLALQKILYFLQREMLMKYNSPLFEDDIEAWQFGPVVPEVYYEYCGFGAMVIERIYDCVKVEMSYDIAIMGYINSIIDNYRTKPPWDLVLETHKKGGAWDKTFADGLGLRRVIKKELIRDEK